MRLSLVRDLITDARCQDELPAICQLGVEFSFQAQQDVTFCTPVIRQVSRTIFHHPDPDVIKSLCTPGGHSCLAFVFRGDNLRPVGDAKRDVFHVHFSFHSEPNATQSVLSKTPRGPHELPLAVRIWVPAPRSGVGCEQRLPGTGATGVPARTQ